MSILETVAEIATNDVVAKKLEGNAEENPQKKENKFVRFIVTIIWLVMAIGVDALAVYLWFSLGNAAGLFLGAIFEAIFGVVTFCVPYLRKKGSYTRWFGVLAILSAVWWIYEIIKM